MLLLSLVWTYDSRFIELASGLIPPASDRETTHLSRSRGACGGRHLVAWLLMTPIDQCAGQCKPVATVRLVLPPVHPYIYPKIRSHRAATTGSTGFISLLLNPPEGSPKPRLNTADRVGASFFCFLQRSSLDRGPLAPGNTPLHLAMESAHAEAACLLIEAGADRTRVSRLTLALTKFTGLRRPICRT